jgi:polysaccharide biosynthesis/export protein
MRDSLAIYAAACLFVVAASVAGSAQAPADQMPGAPAQPAGAILPDDYVIGPEDVVAVLFWREPDMSGDFTVRPDGKITLPLIGDTVAIGLKPEGLRNEIQKAAAKFLADANVTVIIKQINSRKVFITGQVNQPGAFALASPRTVLQLIALAGGLNEFADGDHITIMRTAGGQTHVFKFNYKAVSKGNNLAQNIQLAPGDTVVVP